MHTFIHACVHDAHTQDHHHCHQVDETGIVGGGGGGGASASGSADGGDGGVAGFGLTHEFDPKTNDVLAVLGVKVHDPHYLF